MNETTRSLEDIEIIGGHPAVDFVNTVSAWNVEAPTDYLRDFDAYLGWAGARGLLWPGAVAHFAKAAAKDKQAAFAKIRHLRDDLHAVFSARAARRPLPQASLDHLNDIIRRTVAWRRIAADEETECRDICCVWDFGEAPAIAAIGPVAWQAADLLENGPLDRVKECPGDNCAWLFVDTSKNRSRQWCSMKTCGNTAKVKRFRQKNA